LLSLLWLLLHLLPLLLQLLLPLPLLGRLLYLLQLPWEWLLRVGGVIAQR
jgi:hypothetical protein